MLIFADLVFRCCLTTLEAMISLKLVAFLRLAGNAQVIEVARQEQLAPPAASNVA